MKFKNTKKTLVAVSAFLLAALATGTQITFENEDLINQFLGIEPYEKVTKPGVDNNEFTRYYKSDYKTIAELKEGNKKIIHDTVGEGATLIKNDNNALPYKQGTTVSLMGNGSPRIIVSGTGSSHVGNRNQKKLEECLKEDGVLINETSLNFYKSKKGKGQTVVGKYGPYGERLTQVNTTYEVKWEEAKAATEASLKDTDVIYTVQRVGGEGSDPLDMNHPDGGDHDYLDLNVNEVDTINALAEMNKNGYIKSLTIIINSPYMLSSAYLKTEGVDAALWVGTVGETGQNAIADILTGKINPSGSLPDTYWMDNDYNPANTNQGSFIYTNCEDTFSQADATFTYDSYVVYQEGIYVGYKYAETRYEDVKLGSRNVGKFNYDEVVAYPFGHGLSYTNFDYSDMQIKRNKDGNKTSYDVTVTVTNKGTVAGKEPVQIYVQKPYTEYDKEYYIEKAAVEFVGFEKTKLLQPNESQKVTVNIPEYFFASFDALKEGTFIMDAGDYYLTAATSSHDAINNILAAKGIETSGNSKLAKVALSLTKMDTETYRYALKTGNEVKSLFDFADINRYEGAGYNHVAYLSRDNWVGTYKMRTNDHSTGVKLYRTEQMLADAQLTEDDISAIKDPKDEFPTYDSKKTAFQLINLLQYENGDPIGYNDEIWNDFMDQLSFDDIEALVSNGYHQTIAIPEIGKPGTKDHNGPIGFAQFKYTYGGNGYAVQLNDPDKGSSGTPCPSNSILAATMNKDLIEKCGEVIGEDCMWAGVAGLYGSGGNIHRHNYVGRSFEYFSEDSILAGLSLAQHTRGIQSKGVYVYNKHFALNEQEMHRHGLATWANEQTIRETYLRAFELPIMYDDAKCVMSSFNRIGSHWAGGCRALMTDWLRTEAGMSGFAVTDYMGNPNQQKSSFMGRTWMVAAGGDVSDGNSNAQEFQKYRPGGENENATMCLRMRESAKRILYTVLHSRGMDGTNNNTLIIPVKPWWKTTMVATSGAMAGVLGLACIWVATGAIIDYVKKKQAK